MKPLLKPIPKETITINRWGGYHHDLVIADSEFFNEENLSADAYPTLKCRSRRRKIRNFDNLQGFCTNNGLCWVDYGSVFFNGEKLSGSVSPTGKKQMVAMGALILIWPDKAYFSTQKVSDGVKPLEKTFTTTGSVTFTLTRVTGEDYNPIISETAPENPKSGAEWLDTSVTPNVLKIYSAQSKMWNSIGTTYVKISAGGIGVGFKEYDGVTISGCKEEKLNGDMILYAVSDDYIVITGFIDKVSSQTEAVTISREIPDMDFVTENTNRVWGCSSSKHEIYCCKLGDPFNWKVYLGIASDSYAVTVGTNGDFTGAITYQGDVLFFKEDCVHRVYGSNPSNFGIDDESLRGVQRGSEKSLALVNETLIYKSRNNICAYNGAIPESISDQFGANKYHDAVAGALENKYFVSMADESNQYSLFTYDQKIGCWHRETLPKIDFFATYNGDMYFCMNNELWNIYGDDAYSVEGETSDEGIICWSAESGPIGLDLDNGKFISKIQLRLSVKPGSEFHVALQYDSEGPFDEKIIINSINNRSITVPILVRRCDHVKIRIFGKGDFNLYSVTKEIERGGA